MPGVTPAVARELAGRRLAVNRPRRDSAEKFGDSKGRCVDEA